MCGTKVKNSRAAGMLEMFGWVVFDPSGYLCRGEEYCRLMSVKRIVCSRVGRGVILPLSAVCQRNEGAACSGPWT